MENLGTPGREEGDEWSPGDDPKDVTSPHAVLGHYSLLSHRTPVTGASRASSVSTSPWYHVCYSAGHHTTIV